MIRKRSAVYLKMQNRTVVSNEISKINHRSRALLCCGDWIAQSAVGALRGFEISF